MCFLCFYSKLRIRRLFSDIIHFDKHMKDMNLHFQNRGYPIDLMEDFQPLGSIDITGMIFTHTKVTKALHRSILTTTFHPTDNSLMQIVSNNWNLLGKSHMTLPLHEHRPMVANRKPSNLANLLIRADYRLRNTPKSQPNSDFQHISNA